MSGALALAAALALSSTWPPATLARTRGGLPITRARSAGHGRCGAPAMAETLECNVRRLPRSAVALDIKVPASVSNEVHMKTLATLAKQTKMDGFRSGKVPPQAVIAKLGLQKVKEATIEQVVDVGMAQSGVQGKLNTVGEARLSEKLEDLAARYKIGEAIDFTVEVDVYPEVPLDEAKYTALEVEAERVEFNQAGYDSALLKLRDQHADLVEVGEPAIEGYQLEVNMNGFLAKPDGSKGEPLPNVAGGEGVQIPLSPGKFMPGLVEGLIGVSAGESREVRVTFPPRTSAPSIAGKAAVFVVDCLKVQRRQLPEVPSDEFAAKARASLNLP